MTWLGLDIGGANLKAADGRGWARSIPFALWRHPHGLAGALRALVESAPAKSRIAVTMTGELCDCFTNKADGVRHILAAVGQIAEHCEVRVYLVDGRLVVIEEAVDSPHLAAASNWHVLARFACRFVTGRAGLLIDVGSTTTDVIPLVHGKVGATGRTDTERLMSGELLYRGVARTPICAVTDSLPLRAQRCPVAAEVFATTADIYVLSGELNEDPRADWTADGRPLTKEHARQRLARQLCADASDIGADDFERIVKAVRDAQLDALGRCLGLIAQRLPEPPSTYALSGSGVFLGQAAVEAMSQCRVVSLATEIGPEASECAPAHALAVLAAENC
jgi:probable H4MPT-linked C1 transfer pathway protein